MRSRRNTSEAAEGVFNPTSGQKFPRIHVDVGGTALAWDSRARFAPSEYEKLRGRLDESCKFGYDRYDRSPSPMPELQVPWRACGDAQNNMGSFLPQLAPVP